MERRTVGIETILLHKHENIFTIEAAAVLFFIASKLKVTTVLGHLSVIMTSDSATAPAVFVASLLDADRYRKKAGFIARGESLLLLFCTESYHNSRLSCIQA